MNKRLNRLNRLAFKHHNDGKATITKEDGIEFEAFILVDRGLESVTPDGDINGDEIHIQILHQGVLSSGWQGALIIASDSSLRFRCDRKVNDDGYIIRMSVTQLVT